jgi:iron complex transport system ATP-binding protein
MTLALATKDLAVGYRRGAVLEHVNVSIKPGELVCLLGSNGIGKSTLLRTLVRMQPPLAGQVELGGADLRAISQTDLARRMAVVLTDRVSVDSLTVRQVIELGRHPYSDWLGRMTAGDYDAVDRAIDAVGVPHLADRDLSRLSDGERQRVMIARALAQEPMVLVLDEPTAFLDVPSRVQIMRLLRRLTRERSMAVVMSTHDLELALGHADVLWVVLPDRTLMAGSTSAVVAAGGLTQAFGEIA